MAAWQAQAQTHPFQLSGPALQAAVAALPSTADLEASLAAGNQQCTMGPAAPPSAAALAAAEARRKLEAQRQRDRKAAARKSDRKVRSCCLLHCCYAGVHPSGSGWWVEKLCAGSLGGCCTARW